MRHMSLDGWRGIAAVLIVFFHVNAVQFPLFIHAYMFVDYFLILSGYVIEGAYQSRLTDWHAALRFMRKRFVRIYPVHLVVMAGLVVATGLAMDGYIAVDPSFLKNKTLVTLTENLLLVHTFLDRTAHFWNFPSWTISAELWVYVTYVVIKVALPNRWLMVVATAIFTGSLVFLATTSDHGIDFSIDYSYLRCLMDFMCGILLRQLVGVPRLGKALATPAESLIVIALVAVLWFGGWNRIDFLVPFVFAALVLVYASDSGQIARLLCRRPLQWLGERSYALYMIHVPTFLAYQFFYLRFARAVDWPFVHSDAGELTARVIVVLPVAIVLADVLYRFVEKPSHKLG